MSTHRQLFGDIAFYLPIKVLPAVGIVALIFYLIRVLPPEQYVQYSLGMTIATVSNQIVSGWLTGSVAYFYVLAADRTAFSERIVRLAAGFAALSALAAAFVALFALSHAQAALGVAAVCLAQALFGAISSICQAARRLLLQLWMALVFCAAIAVGAVWLFDLLGDDHVAALAIYASAYGLAVLLFFVFPHRPGASAEAHRIANPIPFAKLAAYGLPLGAWVASMLLLNSGEKFFLDMSDAAAAYLSIKDLLIGATGLLSMPLIMAVHPLVFRIHRAGGDYRWLLAASTDFLSVVFGAFWCFLSVIGFDLIGLLTGKDFHDFRPVTFLVLVSLYLSCLGVYFQKPLEVEARTRRLASIAVVVAVAAVAAFALFVPRYGYPAAAAIFLFAQFVYSLTLLLAAGQPALASLARPLLIFAAVVAVGELSALVVGRLSGELAKWLAMIIWAMGFLAFALIWSAFTLRGVRAEHR